MPRESKSLNKREAMKQARAYQELADRWFAYVQHVADPGNRLRHINMAEEFRDRAIRLRSPVASK